MEVAVIYEEEYTLYDQHYPRSIRDVIARKADESEKDFAIRVDKIADNMKSYHSFFDYDFFSLDE